MELLLGDHEMKRILVIEKVIAGFSSVKDAATELGVSKRQFLRIKKKYIVNGAKSIIHQNKGKVPAHAISKDTSKYKKIEGLKINTIITDIHRSKYF